MLKLHQLYIRKFVILFTLLFFSAGAIIHYWIKDFYIEQTKTALLHNIDIVSIQLKNLSNTDQLAQEIKNRLGLRLTIIDKYGNIVAESHKDKETMENHKYRQEIIQANASSYGFQIRHSDTLKKDFLYVVKKYKIKNKEYFIRVSRELEEINEKMFMLGVKLFFILIVFFAALFFIAYRISGQLQQETNKILQFLLDLTKKRKKQYIKSEFSQEFYQITKLLTKVSQILTKQDKQKSKYTAKLKASNSQKDDIISAISHEFKNPIAVINGYTQTLIDDKNMNREIQNKFLKKVYKSGVRLSGLIDTLRLSIKLEEGKQPLQYVQVNLYNVAQDCIESLKPNYKNREIELSGLQDIKLKVDEVLFVTALTNLIENALKYSEDCVKVEISAKSIRVIDTGIGISKKDLDKITDKFYRVSTNGWNNSLGLGLSIVSNVIDMHNFKLEIDSEENNGSTFTIKF